VDPRTRFLTVNGLHDVADPLAIALTAASRLVHGWGVLEN
jgi:hypothetical protein